MAKREVRQRLGRPPPYASLDLVDPVPPHLQLERTNGREALGPICTCCSPDACPGVVPSPPNALLELLGRPADDAQTRICCEGVEDAGEVVASERDIRVELHDDGGGAGKPRR